LRIGAIQRHSIRFIYAQYFMQYNHKSLENRQKYTQDTILKQCVTLFYNLLCILHKILGNGNDSSGEGLRVGIDVEALELPQQRIPMEAKNSGRLRLVPLHLFEDIQDVLFLEMISGLSQG